MFCLSKAQLYNCYSKIIMVKLLFIICCSLAWNDASNPFYPASGTVPAGVHAIVYDGSWAIAYAGSSIYEYKDNIWTNYGTYTCQ